MELEIPEAIRNLHVNFRDKGHSPTLEELTLAFFEVTMTSSKKTFMIIDTLDEMPDEKCRRKEVLDCLSLITNENLAGLHILCTSRDEMDIQMAMQRLPHNKIRLEKAEVDADIRSYVRTCLNEPESRLFGLSKLLKKEIEEKIGNGACGMYVRSGATPIGRKEAKHLRSAGQPVK